MGAENIAVRDFSEAVDRAFTAANKILVDKVSENIEKSEKAVEAYEKTKEQYYNSFWRMKADYSSLSDKGNPSYQIRRNAMQPQKAEEIVKQLDTEIKKIKAELDEVNPEKRIQALKNTIVAEKKAFEEAQQQEHRFFQQCVVNRAVNAVKNQGVTKQSIAPAAARRPA